MAVTSIESDDPTAAKTSVHTHDRNELKEIMAEYSVAE
jgi:hypothetical protein